MYRYPYAMPDWGALKAVWKQQIGENWAAYEAKQPSEDALAAIDHLFPMPLFRLPEQALQLDEWRLHRVELCMAALEIGLKDAMDLVESFCLRVYGESYLMLDCILMAESLGAVTDRDDLHSNGYQYRLEERDRKKQDAGIFGGSLAGIFGDEDKW